MSLPPCNSKVFKKGVCIAVLGDESSKAVERACQDVTKAMGVPTDWHYAGGRPRVLTLGDPAEAERLFRQALNVPLDTLGVYDEEPV